MKWVLREKQRAHLFPQQRAWNPTFCLRNTQGGRAAALGYCLNVYLNQQKFIPFRASVSIVKKTAGLQSVRNIFDEKQKAFKLRKLGALILSATYLYIYGLYFAIWRGSTGFLLCVKRAVVVWEAARMTESGRPGVNPSPRPLFYSCTIFRKFHQLITPWMLTLPLGRRIWPGEEDCPGVAHGNQMMPGYHRWALGTWLTSGWHRSTAQQETEAPVLGAKWGYCDSLSNICYPSLSGLEVVKPSPLVLASVSLCSSALCQESPSSIGEVSPFHDLRWLCF